MLLTGEGVQLLPQSSNVGFKEGVEASAPRPCGTLLLEEFPLGLQDLILLLKEPDLNDHRGGQKRSQIITKSISLLIFFPHIFRNFFPFNEFDLAACALQ